MAQSFAQLSDPHLTTLSGARIVQLLNKRLLGYISWRRRRRFEHRREVLDRLQADLQGESVSQLLITGDLTHIGLPQEFEQARAWLEQLGPPEQIAVIPGNHEACVSTDWSDTFALWQDYMASDPGVNGSGFPSLRVRDGIAFIGLSTACPTPPLMASGRVDSKQLAALPGLLENTRQQGLFRVLFLHHSPVPGQEKWRKRLVNSGAVRDILDAHGAELVLHGHGHRARRETLASRHGDVPVIAVPSASALGLHGADIAAYNRYRVERDSEGWNLQVQTRRYDREQEVFVAAEQFPVRLERTR
jgi:3',5'-cyclic AMP phosphodiesterase CpdA